MTVKWVKYDQRKTWTVHIWGSGCHTRLQRRCRVKQAVIGWASPWQSDDVFVPCSNWRKPRGPVAAAFRSVKLPSKPRLFPLRWTAIGLHLKIFLSIAWDYDLLFDGRYRHGPRNFSSLVRFSLLLRFFAFLSNRSNRVNLWSRFRRL